MANGIPFVIDTDIGGDVDDALAVTLALASPELDLIGVTVVSGDVDLRSHIVARLLGMAGRADIPVFRGLGLPLGASQEPLPGVTEGIGFLDAPYAGPEATIHDVPAVEWLVEESKRRPFHLAAVGPFTNVAAAAQADPDFAGRLLHLSVMGGAVYHEHFTPEWQRYLAASGQDGAAIDYNTACDPTAALIVARSGVPITWVTAEITFRAPFSRQGLGRIERVGSPLGDALTRMALAWSDNLFHSLQGGDGTPSPVPANAVACFHDPLAVASIFAGDWLTLRPHRLRYEADGAVFRVHRVAAGEDAVADVSVDVDGPAFEQFYLDRVEAFLQRMNENTLRRR